MEEIIGKKKIRVEQCLLQKQYLLLFNLTALLCKVVCGKKEKLNRITDKVLA